MKGSTKALVAIADPSADEGAALLHVTSPPRDAKALLAVVAQALGSLGLRVAPIEPLPVDAPLLEAGEVAAALGVDPRTIYGWARAGLIPCFRLGRKVRFRLGEVIAARRCEGSPAGSRTAPQRRRHAPGAASPTRKPGGARASVEAAPHDALERIRDVVSATRALRE
jgi:excisionase family DNA binding protein